MASLLRGILCFGAASALHAAGPILTVTAPGGAVAFSSEQFAALPRTEITAVDPHGGATHVYSGVAMLEVLSRAGAPLGEKLRGKALQLVVVAHSRDGYATAYALAEFDPAFSDRTILLADREDGKPLGDNAGPFRLVLAGDKRAARWARMVDSLEITSVAGPPAPRP
jgi:hypothetical protein